MAMTAPGTPPPGGPNVVVTIPPITWTMFLSLIGTVLAAAATIIWILVSVVYGGLKDDLKGNTDRVNRLEDHFETAIRADIEITNLLKDSPHLIQDINEIKQGAKQTIDRLKSLEATSKNAIVVSDAIKALLENAPRMEQQIIDMRDAVKTVNSQAQQLLEIKQQLNIMQYQIHQIPTKK
jgi:methyl-accepting chemotaxis protein